MHIVSPVTTLKTHTHTHSHNQKQKVELLKQNVEWTFSVRRRYKIMKQGASNILAGEKKAKIY